MTRAIRTYRVYEDSGVEHLGRVPAHWQVRRLSSLARILNGATPSSANPSYWGGDVPWITPTDLGTLEGRRLHRSARTLTKAGYESCGASFAPNGSIALSTRAPIGHIGILGVPCCSNQGCRLLVPNDSIESDFFYYALARFREELRAFGQGSTFTELSREHLAAFRISLPPRAEQTAIARFLDYADGRIRRAIREKEKLLELLDEQRQAVVEQAVTGQVDVREGRPYPAYKDSGVEWLSRVPTHWRVRKLRQSVTILGGMTPSMNVRRFWGGEIPWVTPKDMKAAVVTSSKMGVTSEAVAETSLRLIDAPAVLMVVRGMILARKVPVARTIQPVTINQDMKALVCGPEISTDYLTAYLACAHNGLFPLIDEAGHGTRRLPTERWRELAIAVPPLPEQSAITRYADRVTADTAAAKDRAERQIALLREYRIRLIADVVAGKVDVREAAANSPRATRSTR